ncbi:hypothetical protein PMAYCL1PPCAC_04227, partial [Pristionchus mayeri]
ESLQEDHSSMDLPPQEVKPTDKSRRVIVFKTKEYKPRESLLTELFASSGEVTVAYNFLAGVFTLFFLRALFDDVVNHGIPFYHLWLVGWNFEQLPSTLLVWAGMFTSTFLPYTLMKYWAHIPAKKVTLLTDSYMLVAYLSYLIGFFYFPIRFLFSSRLNCACSFIITCESTRIAMKVHSFIRENAPRAIERKISGESIKPGEVSSWPSLEQFVYFMFCPAFVYRDEYPRTESIDWSRVRAHATHVFALIEFVNLVFTQFVQPILSSWDPAKVPLSENIIALFTFIPAGMICLICLFYGLLHSWLNLFSELMQFADREFYANWWNSQNMAEYYRNWNLVVHDWLYAYIYKDVAQLIGGRRGLSIAQTAVFFASAVFHEYWFGIAFRVFYPVMFMLYFVFGGIFYAVSRSISDRGVWNIAMWFNLLIGTGMFVAFYGQEWYARTRCAPFSNALVDFVTPRHWSCA